jgi:BMFP domain-containing protein YqiC
MQVSEEVREKLVQAAMRTFGADVEKPFEQSEQEWCIEVDRILKEEFPGMDWDKIREGKRGG